MSSAEARTVKIDAAVLENLQTRLSNALAVIKGSAETVSPAKGAAMNAGVGALIAFIATMEDIKKSELFRKNWWLLPVMIMGIGYWLKRKGNAHASSIVAAGAVMFVVEWRKQPKDEPQAQAPAPQQKPQTSGFQDTGALYPSYPGTVHPMGIGMGWIQNPGGGWYRVALPPALPQTLSQWAQQRPANFANTAGMTQEDADAAANLASAAFAA